MRRHLSRIKGGRLGGSLPPGRLVTLAISDVPAMTRSTCLGAYRADPTTCADALGILGRHGIDVPSRVVAASTRRVGVDEAW